MPLQYAETHFKFRLPWSPLWRPWPEVFLDAPSFCLPGRDCPIFLAVKDAHLFPIEVLSVKWRLQNGKTNLQGEWNPGIKIEDPILFLNLPCPLPQEPGCYYLHASIRLRRPDGRECEFWQANFPFLTPRPLEITRLLAPLPIPDGWQAGEMHCHSDFSSDPVEFGAPLQALQAAGTALGLNFIQVTDHSYDFAYDRHAYMQPCDPTEQFRQYQRQVAACNADSKVESNPGSILKSDQATCFLIAGEEVSCGNAQGENVHLLVMGPPDYIPGLGDGGRRGLNNRPDLRIEEVLERLPGIPCFAAHPRVRIGRVERFIFRRGPWDKADLSASTQSYDNLRGLQFWNGSRSRDFHDGKRFWVEALLEGKKLLPIGANDAHGDFNQNVGVKWPLFSLYRSRNHILGKVRTLFPASHSDLPQLQKAAMGSVATATDGPFICLTREPKGSYRIETQSSADFGIITRIQVVAGQKGQRSETRLVDQTPNTFQFDVEVVPPIHWDYIRAEAQTSLDRFALTSAFFRS